ncbi:ankyrin-1-like [Belonocnema kinseyi]|uniref:ankyrin-1-like n=1 Tax=Belonocnema kinseyi TaxID=2817044 RepID=UPI00143CD702|nr:ankyrin-1-like [Belonocnema kinseyi]XP_033231274.1 ankyrin-1-like [Belonocnema kinseyi]
MLQEKMYMDEEIQEELATAVKQGNMEAVKRITSSLNSKYLQQWPEIPDLISLALTKKQSEIAKFLIINGGLEVFTTFIYPELQGRNTKLAIANGDLDTLKMIKPLDSASDLIYFSIVERLPVDKDVCEIFDFIFDQVLDIEDTNYALYDEKYKNHTLCNVLQYAAKCGNVDILPLILKKKANIDARTDMGQTALHIAAKNGHSEVIDFLLKHGAKHDVQDKNKKTALRLAAEKEDEPSIKILVDYTFRQNNTPILEDDFFLLYCAAATGNQKILEILLQKSIDINQHFEATKKTPLLIAVENGHPDVVQLIINQGLPGLEASTLHLAAKSGCRVIFRLLLQESETASMLTSVDKYGYTPLHVAVENGHRDIVEICLERTSSGSITNKGLLPIHIAAHKGYDKIVLQLLEQCADYHSCTIKSEDSFTPLYIAAYYGHKRVVEILLEKGADPNNFKCYEPHLTPLHAAAQGGHDQIVELLLKCGAKVNLEINIDSDEILCTPILAAARGGHERIVEMLLHYGANIKTKVLPSHVSFTKNIECIFSSEEKSESKTFLESTIGYTPLHFAAQVGNTKIVEMLLRHGADVNSMSDIVTPLTVALKKKHEKIVQILLKAGANVNLRASTKQEFPLHCAIEMGNEQIVRELIDSGARIDSVCSEELTPFFHAVKKGNVEMLKALLRKGAAFESKTVKGVPLVHFAFNENSGKKMLRFLLRCGADVDAKNEDDMSLLHMIIDESILWDTEHYGQSEVLRLSPYSMNKIKLLLEYGADVNATSAAMKNSVLDSAAMTAKDYAIELFLESAVDVNITNGKGYTPGQSAFKKLLLVKEKCDICHRPTYRDVDHANFWYNSSGCICSGCNRPYVFDDMIFKTPERSTKALQNVLMTITQEVVRLQVALKDTKQQNFELIECDNIKPFANYCRTEIDKMRISKIAKNITCFDVLVGSAEKLRIYSTDERVMEAVKLQSYFAQFPAYGIVLKARFKQGIERRGLYEKNMELFYKTFDMKLPYLIIFEIFEYLKREDLIKLWIAFTPVNLDTTVEY